MDNNKIISVLDYLLVPEEKIKEMILMEEQKYIDMFSFEQLYNLNPKADSTLGLFHTL